MTTRNAEFYFANLGADVDRCISAAIDKDLVRYTKSLTLANHTLAHLQNAGDIRMYEKGLMLLSELEQVRSAGKLDEFRSKLNQLIEPYVLRILSTH